MLDPSKATENHVRGLLRRSEGSLTAECRSATLQSGLISTILENVHGKKQFDKLFATSESAEKWASDHSLGQDARNLLLIMQEHRHIFVPNATLDRFLTLFFLLECGYVVVGMYTRGYALGFVGLLALTHVVISSLKSAAAIFGRLTSRLLFNFGLVDCDPLSGPIQMKKWTEQAWQLGIHVFFAALEGWILSTEPWYTDFDTCWFPLPAVFIKTVRPELVLVYMAQLAVWMYTCIVHRFFDERRKDYFVLYLHHIITIMLVAMSFFQDWLRGGLTVLWVHDVSDVFVDLLKMVNYLKLEGPRGYFASEMAYAACVSGWVYWRLYQFPFRVIPGSMWASLVRFTPETYAAYGWKTPFLAEVPAMTFLCTLLCVLLVLHVYWAYLLFMVGYRILTESAREASRQEYEGDSDDETLHHDTAPNMKKLAAADAAANALKTSADVDNPHSWQRLVGSVSRTPVVSQLGEGFTAAAAMESHTS